MDTNNSGGSIGNFNWFRFRNTNPNPPPGAPSNLAAALASTSQHQPELDRTTPPTKPASSSNEKPAKRRMATADDHRGERHRAIIDSGVVAATSYTYRVRATNATGESLNSNEATVTTPAAQQTTYLSDLPWVSATGGYGPVEHDMANGGSDAGDGTPITLNGVVYPKGLGTHATSDIVYNLGAAVQHVPLRRRRRRPTDRQRLGHLPGLCRRREDLTTAA